MSTKSRTFNSEILIDSQNRWFYRGIEIVHPTILEFFKENLYEDEKGIFIQNVYGAFSEKGYVECRGFAVFFFRLWEENSTLKFEGNNKKFFSADELNFFYDDQERLFAIPKQQKFIKYGFSKSVLNQISEWLQIDETGEYKIVYKNSSYDVKFFSSQFEVTVPLLL